MIKTEFYVSPIFIQKIETNLKRVFVFVFFIINIFIFLPTFNIDEGFRSFIYYLFSFVCHQSAELSFWINGNKLAVCSRCTGIYQSFLIFSILFTLKKTLFKKEIFFIIFSLSVIFFLISKIVQIYYSFEIINFFRWLSGVLIGIIFSYSIYADGGKSG